MTINKGDIVKINKDVFKKNGKVLFNNNAHLFVVLNKDDNNMLTCCTISSAKNKVNKKYKYNIPINDISQAHLNKPDSHVKVDKQTIKISENDIIQKIGHLSNEDYINIMTAFHKVPESDIEVMESLNLFNLLKQL